MQFLLDRLMIRGPPSFFRDAMFKILKFALYKILYYDFVRRKRNFLRALILISQRCILRIVLPGDDFLRSYLPICRKVGPSAPKAIALGQYLILRDWKCNGFLCRYDRSHVAHKAVSQDPENRASIFTHTLVFAHTGIVGSGMPRDSEFSALAQTYFGNQVSSVIIERTSEIILFRRQFDAYSTTI